MLKATDYTILRRVQSNGGINIPLARNPVRVATLIDEAGFTRDQLLIHNKTVFMEDRIHDWIWRDGQFRYYTRVAEVADVVVVFALEKTSDAPGRPLNLG